LALEVFSVAAPTIWNSLPIGVRARGLGGGCSPPDSGKPIIFRAKAKIFGQKPAAKNEKRSNFLYLLKEKNGIHSV